jgi:hypothetical protein
MSSFPKETDKKGQVEPSPCTSSFSLSQRLKVSVLQAGGNKVWRRKGNSKLRLFHLNTAVDFRRIPVFPLPRLLLGSIT